MKKALVSIIVPVHNAPAQTRACLDSVRRNTRKPYELIVVDDASGPATAGFLDSREGIRLIRNKKNLGFARSVNAGMRAANGDYIVWLNSDAIVTTGWLDAMLACARSDRQIGAVGPVTNDAKSPQAIVDIPRDFSLGNGRVDALAALWARHHGGSFQTTHRLTGFCLLLKRHAVRAVGAVDERFGRGYAEDLDYCLRLIQAGYRLAIAKGTFVYHQGRASFSAVGDAERMDEKARRLFVEKWCRLTLMFMNQFNEDLKERPRPSAMEMLGRRARRSGGRSSRTRK